MPIDKENVNGVYKAVVEICNILVFTSKHNNESDRIRLRLKAFRIDGGICLVYTHKYIHAQ